MTRCAPAFGSPARQFLPRSCSPPALLQSHDDVPLCISSDGRGGMPMNPSLTSALSEFSKRSEFSKSGLAAELADEPPLHPSELNLIRRVRSWLGKLVPFAFVRFLMIFFVGVTATLAWQSYGGATREAIARWSPRLAWLVPPAAPAPPDQIVAISRDLAVVRQSVDKLAADFTKLQVPQQGADRTSASPPSAAAVPARKPGSQTR